MQADLPKTINEAIKILAYNDFLWPGTPIPPKTKIKPSSQRSGNSEIISRSTVRLD